MDLLLQQLELMSESQLQQIIRKSQAILTDRSWKRKQHESMKYINPFEIGARQQMLDISNYAFSPVLRNPTGKDIDAESYLRPSYSKSSTIVPEDDDRIIPPPSISICKQELFDEIPRGGVSTRY